MSQGRGQRDKHSIQDKPILYPCQQTCHSLLLLQGLLQSHRQTQLRPESRGKSVPPGENQMSGGGRGRVGSTPVSQPRGSSYPFCLQHLLLFQILYSRGLKIRPDGGHSRSGDRWFRGMGPAYGVFGQLQFVRACGQYSERGVVGAGIQMVLIKHSFTQQACAEHLECEALC